MTVRVRRAYDPPAAEDGCRVLVDRLWPRGLARENARIEHWLRELAPSNELRAPAAAAALAALHGLLAAHPVLTLLHAARDTTHNNAEALRQWLEAKGAPRAARE